MARQRTVSDEQILEQARACFLEHGPGISTTVIAERIGVSHGVLFQRFGTKEQLLRAALSLPQEQPWLARARAGPDERDFETQLRELAREISAHFERLIPCIAVLRSAGLEVDHKAVRREDSPPVRARREIIAWFERALARGLLRPVPPEHAADLFMGALFVRPFYEHSSRHHFEPSESRAYVDFTVDVLCRTLARKPKPG